MPHFYTILKTYTSISTTCMHIHTALCTIYYSISLELKKKTNKGGAFFHLLCGTIWFLKYPQILNCGHCHITTHINISPICSLKSCILCHLKKDKEHSLASHQCPPGNSRRKHRSLFSLFLWIRRKYVKEWLGENWSLGATERAKWHW